MSIRTTIKLNRIDLKYLLIDSLKKYSDNVYYIGGNNPYTLSVNKKKYNIYIRNIHASGQNRDNQDECRIQVSNSNELIQELGLNNRVIIIGYFKDENVFTAWDPIRFKNDFTNSFFDLDKSQTRSYYSRFSIQSNARVTGISSYVDNNRQSIISFIPDYLGFYIENIDKIHRVDESYLRELIKRLNERNFDDNDNNRAMEKEKFLFTYKRYKRNPKFRRIVCRAYNNCCAMCGISLDLIEAAHIIPHSHIKGTDSINNGIALCSIHHTSYDNALVYFDENYYIYINNAKLKYLTKIHQDFGYQKFNSLQFKKLVLPKDKSLIPNPDNIFIANNIRGIS